MPGSPPKATLGASRFKKTRSNKFLTAFLRHSADFCRFWEPSKSEAASNTAQLKSIRRLFGALRRPKGETNWFWKASGKNTNYGSKINAQMDGFWWLGTTFGVILFAYFTLSPFLKKIEKSMPKLMPKGSFLVPKPKLGRPRIDWFDNFCGFLRIPKIIDF